ncbi:uncharacterized protein LOC108935556 isoform X2 [Scleropages formosus]|uniref:uncharacterized protein LOC108935556 isoform X2 n=1 Tax=Scleropages formosus TaxID=113540 RepID=UPI0010FA8876|nr:uncharacterized protein LOC108935556 isoform X2 [Scleropages formosus]
MSLGLWGLCVVLLEAGMLVAAAAAASADEDWVDPTDMLRYDATSKTMKRERESAQDAKGKVQTYARDETLEDENSAMEHNCHNKLSILQNEIENLKYRVNYLLEQEGLNLDPESKLTQLLHSIQQLNTLQEDDSSTFPLEWLMENIIKSKRCISMLLLMVYTYIMELSDVLHNSSDVAPWLLCAVITFTLTCMLVKHLKKTMKQHEQPRENDGQGDDDFPNRQHDDWQPDNEGQEDHYHSLDNPINMPAEVLNPEGLDEQNNGAAEQVLAGMADECCNENFEITKMPTAETQPASQYSS